MPEAPPHSDRVRVHRLPARGHYDRATVEQILDEGIMCHLGILDDAGRPVVIPTLYGRDGDALLLHGSNASRALRRGATMPVCVTVTHLDGLVLARSLFNHSANYRSVVVLGDAVEVTDAAAKMAALHVISEHLLPGRWDEARPPDTREMKATTVLRLDLRESSAKIRSGPPGDDDRDMALPFWAGEIPLSVTAGPPRPDPQLAAGIQVPPSVRRWVPGAERLRGSPT